MTIFRDYVGEPEEFWKCQGCGRKSRTRERICPSCGEVDRCVAVVARVVGRRKPFGIPVGIVEVEEIREVAHGNGR